ncbi:MAG: glycosyltransferase [Campylobacterota bacterium]|nr:glycosyltransferase [Campylobacterota bacterium]
MKKLLYITDQGEYVDHSFIGALFETYLKKYLTIDIVYFTEFKSDFEKKDEHRFVVPTRYKTSLLDELKRNSVDVDSYEFVIVRNDMDILEHVIKQKNNYNFKTGYRLSFPKRRAQLKSDIANNKATLMDKVFTSFAVNKNFKIINKADFFLPTSKSMHQDLFCDVTIKTFICPAGIDPNKLHPNLQHQGEEKRFIYEGTLDKLREFDVILDAFSKVESNKWHLSISTLDTKYANELMDKYKNIKDNILIINARDKDELLDIISKADVGISLLPDIPVYNTSVPIKTFDYYSSAVPTIMTNTAHASGIFKDNIDAWFCGFSSQSIKQKIEYITTLSKDEVAKIGQRGQDRLLDIKNYEKIAKDLAAQIETL